MIQIKIACISDLHGFLPDIFPLKDEIDILFLAGDLCWHESIKEEEKWLKGKFSDWISAHGIPTIAIGGNHDFYIEKEKDIPNITILENTSISLSDGSRVFGCPFSLKVGEWAYQASESDLESMMEKVESDIVLSHGPPIGYGDRVYYPFNQHVGSFALKNYILTAQPKLVIYGHIHSGNGLYQIGESVLVNCAFVNEQYRPVGKIYIIDYDGKVNNVYERNIGIC